MKETWLEKLGIRSKPSRKWVVVTEPFTVVGKRSANTVCNDFDLQAEARPYLHDQPAPHEFVNRLVQAECHLDAVRFLAHALPERDAVRWACWCVRQVPLCFNDDTAQQALAAADAWVECPEYDTQRLALEASQQLDFEMPTAPCAWVAMAAGQAKTSESLNENPSVAPTKNLSAHAAAGAIALATTTDTERATEHYVAFLKMGVTIAQGQDFNLVSASD